MTSLNDDDGLTCIPGLGDNKQKPRVLGSFFDYVDDAFSGRSPSLPSETDSVGSRSVSVAEASSSMSESVSRASSVAASDDITDDNETLPNDCQEEDLIKTELEIDDQVDNEHKGPADIFDQTIKTILIKNCSIVTGDGGTNPACDILVEDGDIKEISSNVTVEDELAVKKIDANGGFLTVGGINIINSGGQDENSYLSSGVTMTLHNLSFVSGVNIIETCAKIKKTKTNQTQSNFGFILQLGNINELSRNEVQTLAETGDINMISFTATKLNNSELIGALKHVRQLGCVARLMVDSEGDMSSHLSRLAVSHGHGFDEDVEVTQVRRLCTIIRQVGVVACISGISHTESLNIVREFSATNEIYAEMADTIDGRVRRHVEHNRALQDIVILSPVRDSVTNLLTFVKMSSDNVARMLRMSPRMIEVGSVADFVIWRKEDTEDNVGISSEYRAEFVIVNGQVCMKQEGEVNPCCSGQFVQLSRVEMAAPEPEDIKHVEREMTNGDGDKSVNGGNQKVTIDPAGVTSQDQVPKMFQRRVSAFGVRNQQDSSFCLTDPDADMDPDQHHMSLTGSRRASVKVAAPPGGLSSGFW